MRIVAILALTLGLTAPASAQSLYGPGGLFLFPTASVPPKGQLTPGILVLPQHNPAFDSTRTWLSGSLDYGLTDDLEIGATIVKVGGWQRDASAGGFFKYRLLDEEDGLPAVAIGFTQLAGGDVNTRVGFLALKKSWTVGKDHPLIGHVGVQYADEIDGISRHEWQPYAGLEYGITTRLSFIVEGRPRMRAEFGAPIALTLAYQVSDDWRLALTWANNGLSDTPKFGFGAGISLGSRR
ncbi:MAG: YjbH domain-containing protein [Actinomycetota bacterium]